jgi:hypothetical protein
MSHLLLTLLSRAQSTDLLFLLLSIALSFLSGAVSATRQGSQSSVEGPRALPLAVLGDPVRIGSERPRAFAFL